MMSMLALMMSRSQDLMQSLAASVVSLETCWKPAAQAMGASSSADGFVATR